MATYPFILRQCPDIEPVIDLTIVYDCANSSLLFDERQDISTHKVMDLETHEGTYYHGYRKPRFTVPAIPCVAVFNGYPHMIYIDDHRFGEDDPQMVRAWDFYPTQLPNWWSIHIHCEKQSNGCWGIIPGHQPVPAHQYNIHFTYISVEIVTGITKQWYPDAKPVFKGPYLDCSCVYYAHKEDFDETRID